MRFEDYQAGRRAIPSLAGLIAASVALEASGSVLVGSAIQPLPALALFFVLAFGCALASDALLLLAGLLEWLAARSATGIKGSAGWARRLSEVKADLIARAWGPYWGVLRSGLFKRRQPVFADYSSCAMTVGTSGSGKGVGVVQPMALAIRYSKTIIDFKGELSCVLASALRKRGERVRILNLGDLWTDRLGPSDQYNPLHLLADDFWREGGLQDVSDDIHEMCMQLLPEPTSRGGQDGDVYFRDGSRSFVSFAAQTCVLVDGEQASLGDVAQMLSDRASLLKHALWACGKLLQGEDENGEKIFARMPLEDSPWTSEHDPEDVGNYIAYYRGLASGVADLLLTEESRTADSFVTGAQQALARFNISTRAHKKTKGATFRFAEQKDGDGPTTVFIIADASRTEAQKPVLGLLQFCMMQELKRHPNKDRPVYLLADEATNFKLAELGSLLTWGRGYGLRLHLIIQSLSAFKATYGEDVLNVLLSETEIKQFLPGQREPETLALIEKLLGEQSLIAQNHQGDRARALFGAAGFSMNEEGRALMTADEIRRMRHGLLFLRKNKPMKIELPPIAAIEPFRRQIDVNPFHGKPFLKKTVLRLRRRAPKRGKRGGRA